MDLFSKTRIVELQQKGQEDISTDKKGHMDAQKSRIMHFPSISTALSRLDYGGVFTTPASDNIYVVTRGTWGEKSQSKVVKGFPAGTSMSVIKAYSERTKSKHGTGKGQDVEGEEEREKHGFATKSAKNLQRKLTKN